ncbi:MAG TPA: hypothetical protein ENJ19_04760 [Gammaproteobacteria bacterium]|nr:hypothetical protein [Gammaproteobacteria bacterium]
MSIVGAYARRKFVEAGRAAPAKKKGQKVSKASVAIGKLRKLYAIEQRIEKPPPEEKTRQRQALAGAVLEDLKRWLDHNLTRVPKDSLTGKAIAAIYSLISRRPGPTAWNRSPACAICCGISARPGPSNSSRPCCHGGLSRLSQRSRVDTGREYRQRRRRVRTGPRKAPLARMPGGLVICGNRVGHVGAYDASSSEFLSIIQGG